MGLNKRNSNVTYLNLKEGKIYESTDKERTNPYDEVEGQITNMSFRDDEFEGHKIRKFNVTINDGETDYVLSMKVDSSYFSSLVGFLKSADLSKPLTLIPFFKKDKETEKSNLGIWVKQDGTFMKAYYTKDNPNGLPPFKKVTINRETKYDKTDFLEYLEGVIVNDFKPQLKQASTDKPKGLTKSPDVGEESQEVVLNDATDEVADDLPF